MKNIFLILEDKRIFNVEAELKKNYNTLITKEYLQIYLPEAKDLFSKNYPKQSAI